MKVLYQYKGTHILGNYKFNILTFFEKPMGIFREEVKSMVYNATRLE